MVVGPTHKTSVLKPGGSRAVNDDYKTVFVQGAYNLGCVLHNFEVVTAGFQPGMFVDPKITVGLEMECTIGADASIVVLGVAEVDFGTVKNCSVAYVTTDSAPLILPHWNPGALLRNLVKVDAGADKGPASFMGTNSGTDGKFKADITVNCFVRAQDFIVSGATANFVGWFESFAP